MDSCSLDSSATLTQCHTSAAAKRLKQALFSINQVSVSNVLLRPPPTHTRTLPGPCPPPSGCWPRFKAAVKQLKRDVLALYYAVHDPRTPLLSKLLPWLVLAYALSPLDLIPDFIPVLGFLDDMLLLPLGLWLSFKLIPAEVGWGWCVETGMLATI